MAILKFSLSPESTGRIHDLLLCLAKFGEYVSFEAKGDRQLTLGALNSSRTGYASFTLDPKTFFISYSAGNPSGRFTCQMYNKALLSVFKGRTADARNPEGGIDRCDVSIEDQPDKVKCRMVVKMLCLNGVTKTYRLNYESVEVSHALFDKTTAPFSWKISSRLLREYIEYFSPKTEQLDFMAKDGKAIFTSFTEKVMDGKEILKQPLETAITISVDDFDDFQAEEDVHITISVKDFRAIVTHADTLKGTMTAYFSRPARPLQYFYQATGMTCEFTLMTRAGDSTPSASPTPQRTISNRPGTKNSSRQSSHQPSLAPITMSPQPTITPDPSVNEIMNTTEKSAPSSRQNIEMGPPPKPVTMARLRERRQLSARNREPSQASTTSDRDSESLFMPRHDDEERRWDPPDFEQEEPEEMLGWDAHADIVRALVKFGNGVADISVSMVAPIPLSVILAAMRQVRLERRAWRTRKVYRLRKDYRRYTAYLIDLRMLSTEVDCVSDSLISPHMKQRSMLL